MIFFNAFFFKTIAIFHFLSVISSSQIFQLSIGFSSLLLVSFSFSVQTLSFIYKNILEIAFIMYISYPKISYSFLPLENQLGFLTHKVPLLRFVSEVL